MRRSYFLPPVEELVRWGARMAHLSREPKTFKVAVAPGLSLLIRNRRTPGAGCGRSSTGRPPVEDQYATHSLAHHQQESL